MGQYGRKTATLPRHLLDKLGVQDSTPRKYSSRPQPQSRKENRKAARIQKKSKATAPYPSSRWKSESGGQSADAQLQTRSSPPAARADKAIMPKSILKTSKPTDAFVADYADGSARSVSPPLPLSVPRSVRDRLADDDAEIAALEKVLGVKNTKKLPKSFGEDGLDILLEGSGPSSAERRTTEPKRKRSEEDDWLRAKRLKATESGHSIARLDRAREHNDDRQLPVADEIFEDSNIGSEEGSDAGPFEDLAEEASNPEPQRRVRENPYIAPAAGPDVKDQIKYIPPSKRSLGKGAEEDMPKLRRQMQGLLNRLSEANLISILKKTEGLYQENPRQIVNTILIDLLMGLLCDPTILQDAFVILHAGFIAALFKVLGPEFGAQILLRIYVELTDTDLLNVLDEATGKKMSNLASLLAHLYNFKVVGSGLIYDVVRLLIEELSEKNAELLLRIVRNSGTQLRKDDTTSLKAINQLLQSAVVKVGLENVSVRTNFMLETIDSLANKGVKTGKAESAINSEHVSRMRTILGTLNERSLRALEPLNIRLKDLRESGGRGKWWIVGASYRDNENLQEKSPVTQKTPSSSPAEPIVPSTSGEEVDLHQLARQLGLNTDIRRSIFVTLMSGDDFETACDQLRRLPLNARQRLDIPRVLIRCSGAQEQYNPYYTLIARRLISREPKLKKAFQYSLWNLFAKLRQEGAESEETVEAGSLGLRSVTNQGIMFGTLIAEDGLPMNVLKDLNFVYLPDELQHLAEVLLITVILCSQEFTETGRNETPLVQIFLKVKDNPEMAQGLRYFLKKVVSKSDIAGSRERQATVKWGCKVASHALKALPTTTATEYTG
ncbi:MAG: hypothetical protein Q9195_000328 [Heterodermia aff. obscurata]